MDIPLGMASASGRERSGLSLSDELMVNAGSRIMYNVFDQNRVYVGLYTAVGPGSRWNWVT